MRKTGITWHFSIEVQGESGPATEARLEQQLTAVMDALLDLEECNPEVHDPSVGASLAEGTAEIELTVDTESSEEAVRISRSIIRTAIHTAGGFTPDWDHAAARPHTAQYRAQKTQLDYV
jgi:hypothetical protein